ncbi:peptidase family M48-domain-containing protein [Irpex lacteus]|nr:peptidase family M48-domain-containing protein [Irpex lacteus]
MFAARRTLATSLSSKPTAFFRTSRPRLNTRTQFFSTNSSLQQQIRYQRFNNTNSSGGFFSSKRRTLGEKILVGAGVLGGVYYVAHLEKVPETGRWRFMNSSPALDAQVADMARKALLEDFQGKLLPPNHPLTLHVAGVVSKILNFNNLGTLKTPHPVKVLGHPTDDEFWGDSGRTDGLTPETGGKQWELLVVDDDKVVNAAAAYGNIIVFTGILPVARNEQGLAAVLAHEIGHVVARHNAEKASSQMVFFALATLVSVALQWDFGLASSMANLVLALPHSRTMEFEADAIGLKLMAKACYDPRAAPEMFERLGKIEEQQGVRSELSFMYTHPSSKARVERLEQKLPEAYDIRASSPECAGILDKLMQFNATRRGGWDW